MLRLFYDRGSLVAGLESQTAVAHLPDVVLPYFMWDERTRQWRARGCDYRAVVETLKADQQDYEDQVRKYAKLDLKLAHVITPRAHQKEAMEAWFAAKGRGCICLPTGAGKTILAIMIMARVQRATLVVVPTIDLMQQWLQVLEKFFGGDIGLMGGRQHDVQSITVATYDSASIHAEKLANQFGFLIFDECHHLPAPQYQFIAKSNIAPFRLGLSATMERPDGLEQVIYELIGPLVYEGQVQRLIGSGLAPYDVVTIPVKMTESEKKAYQKARATYVGFLREQQINMSSPDGWRRFLMLSSRLAHGREAFVAYLEQKKLAQAAENKIKTVWALLQKHATERVIVFTADNEMAYKIGCELFLPVLTHQTPIKERKKMLEKFRSGAILCLVTAKVLNEGVDVPEASVGIIVSGSGSVREHVQRLGRILRQGKNKRAVLYELITEKTAEARVSKRRREHHAYQEANN